MISASIYKVVIASILAIIAIAVVGWLSALPIMVIVLNSVYKTYPEYALYLSMAILVLLPIYGIYKTIVLLARFLQMDHSWDLVRSLLFQYLTLVIMMSIVSILIKFDIWYFVIAMWYGAIDIVLFKLFYNSSSTLQVLLKSSIALAWYFTIIYFLLRRKFKK